MNKLDLKKDEILITSHLKFYKMYSILKTKNYQEINNNDETSIFSDVNNTKFYNKNEIKFMLNLNDYIDIHFIKIYKSNKTFVICSKRIIN